jgi:class 3 adenylate cyclase
MIDDNSSMKRRLAAILAADIAGYSRLMGEDEAATVRDLKGHQAVILPLVTTAASLTRPATASWPSSRA